MSDNYSKDLKINEDGKKPMRFLGFAIGTMTIIAMTLFGGYMVHEKIMNTELRFKKLDTYIKCVDLNEKDTCKFILGDN